MEFLSKVRYRLRAEGIFEKIERDKIEKEEVEKKNREGEDLLGGDDTPSHTPEKGDLPFLQREENESLTSIPPTGRPEWEVLTPSKIDLTEDQKLYLHARIACFNVF